MRGKMKGLIALASITVFVMMSGAAMANKPPWCYEGDGYNCEKCGARTVAFALSCTGDYCAGIQPECWGVSGFFIGQYYWTNHFSEEQGQAFCAPGYVVEGLDCDGYDNRCDDVAMRCVELVGAVQDESKCFWTPWISEEPTPDPLNDYAGDTVSCGATAYIHGIECDGGWCDNMRLRCCDY